MALRYILLVLLLVTSCINVTTPLELRLPEAPAFPLDLVPHGPELDDAGERDGVPEAAPLEFSAFFGWSIFQPMPVPAAAPHRALAPSAGCQGCHAPGGLAGIPFTASGYVWTEAEGNVPAADVEVAFLSPSGARVFVRTDIMGAFYLRDVPVRGWRAAVRNAAGLMPCGAPLLDGACAACHATAPVHVGR